MPAFFVIFSIYPFRISFYLIERFIRTAQKFCNAVFDVICQDKAAGSADCFGLRIGQKNLFFVQCFVKGIQAA